MVCLLVHRQSDDLIYLYGNLIFLATIKFINTRILTMFISSLSMDLITFLSTSAAGYVQLA